MRFLAQQQRADAIGGVVHRDHGEGIHDQRRGYGHGQIDPADDRDQTGREHVDGQRNEGDREPDAEGGRHGAPMRRPQAGVRNPGAEHLEIPAVLQRTGRGRQPLDQSESHGG